MERKRASICLYCLGVRGRCDFLSFLFCFNEGVGVTVFEGGGIVLAVNGERRWRVRIRVMTVELIDVKRDVIYISSSSFLYLILSWTSSFE